MTRLLIQCQGSPGPLSFKISKSRAATILKIYHNMPERRVIQVTKADGYCYYVDLSLVTWMCVVDESEPDPTPTKAS